MKTSSTSIIHPLIIGSIVLVAITVGILGLAAKIPPTPCPSAPPTYSSNLTAHPVTQGTYPNGTSWVSIDGAGYSSSRGTYACIYNGYKIGAQGAFPNGTQWVEITR